MKPTSISALLVGASCAAAVPLVEERGSCNADNLLRLLRATSNLPDAVPFCSSYLALPASTLAATVTPTITVDTTETLVLTDVTTVTVTNVGSGVDTVTQTSYIATTTVTQGPTLKRRKACSKTALSDRVISSYPASRISSACECLTIPISVATGATVTAPAVTQTSVATVSNEVTVTETQTVVSSAAGSPTTVTQAATCTIPFTSPTAVPTSFVISSYDAQCNKVYFLGDFANDYKTGYWYWTTPNKANAAVWTLTSEGHITTYGGVAPFYNLNDVSSGSSDAVVARPDNSGGYSYYTFNISSETLELEQTSVEGLGFETCLMTVGNLGTHDYWVASKSTTTGCRAINAYVEAA